MSVRRLPLLTLLLCAPLVACEPALPPPEEPTRLVYANPGWTHRDRQIYYYTPQGTELHGVRYSWLRNLELPFSDQRLADPELLARMGFILDPHANPAANPGGLPIGLTHHADPEGGDAFVDITCAACHTGQLHYEGTAIRIDGGQAMHAIASTKPGQFAATLVTSLLHTYLDPFEFDGFAERVLGVEYPKDKGRLRDDLARSIQKFVGEAWHGRDLYPTSDGFGRTDALGHIANAVFGDGLDFRNYREANAPVSFPHVWDIWKFDWVQWNGSVAQPMGRNVGEALGVKAPLDMVDEYGSTLAPDDRFRSGVLVEELHCIESTLWHLQPPVWPEDVLPPIDREKAARGAELYQESCQRCHGPHRYSPRKQLTPGKPFEWRMTLASTTEMGTDPLAAANFVQYRYDASTVDPSAPALAEVGSGDALDAVTLGVILKKYEELGVDEETRWWFDGFGRATQVQVERAYKARPLHGIWATPPFLHNGSVPTLYQMLVPEEERDATFWVGTREFDAVDLGYRRDEIEDGFLFDTSLPGNANTGHQFRDDGGAGVIGRALAEDERYAILEFLKVLGDTDPRYECLWRSPRQRDRRCPEDLWPRPSSPERLSDPRHPEEMPPVRMPSHFAGNGEGNGKPALRDGLPAPQCTPIDAERKLQGPASLPTTLLPDRPSRRTLRERASAAGYQGGYR